MNRLFICEAFGAQVVMLHYYNVLANGIIMYYTYTIYNSSIVMYDIFCHILGRAKCVHCTNAILFSRF